MMFDQVVFNSYCREVNGTWNDRMQGGMVRGSEK